MRTAWIECATGISGDMTLAALIDAGADLTTIRNAIDSLGLPDVRLRVETVIKGGFRSLHVLVDHPEQHAHRHFSDIRKLLEQSSVLTERQKHLALQMFRVIAEAEARVHGSSIEKVHFHEVGAIDSIVDIVGVAVAFDLLKIDRVVCNSVPTGRGFVRIDHGICPVPAPGTAEILKGIPLRDVPVDAELTTPTGAAIVKTLAHSFGSLPAMTIESIGCGCGTLDFPPRANVLRIFIGQQTMVASAESVVLLETNLDDVSGEIIGYARERLMTHGALDVFTIPVQMKKDRPGTILSVLCRPDAAGVMEDILFRETGTLGIRRHLLERSVRQREMISIQTPWGAVRAKKAWRPGEAAIVSPEFEDCAAIARQHGIPLTDVYRAAEAGREVTSKHDHDHHGHDHDHHGHGHDHHGHGHDHHGHDHDHHGHDHDHHGHDHDHHGHDHDGHGHDHHGHDHDHHGHDHHGHDHHGHDHHK